MNFKDWLRTCKCLHLDSAMKINMRPVGYLYNWNMNIMDLHNRVFFADHTFWYHKSFGILYIDFSAPLYSIIIRNMNCVGCAIDDIVCTDTIVRIY